MTTVAKSLPVVAGAVGAAVEVGEMALKKTVVVTDLQGTVTIEAGINGEWCSLKTFAAPDTDETFEIVCAEMRVNATSGGSATVAVAAERTQSEFVTLPADGSSVDVTALAEQNTAFSPGEGSHVEISQDGVNWAQVFQTFNAAGCDSECFSAVYARAVGGVDIQLGAQPKGSGDAFSAPRTAFVWRPGATGEYAPGGNVYTEWAEVYAAIQATPGPKRLVVDSDHSTVLNPDYNFGGFFPNGNRVAEVPAGTWDMTNTIISGLKTLPLDAALGISSSLAIIQFGDDAVWEGINIIDGQMNTQLTFIGNNTNGPSLIQDPLRGVITIIDEIQFTNTDPAAQPIIQALEGQVSGAPTVLYYQNGARNAMVGTFLGSFGQPSAAPTFGLGPAGFMLIVMENGRFQDDAIGDVGGTGGFLLVRTNSSGASFPPGDQMVQPSFTGTILWQSTQATRSQINGPLAADGELNYSSLNLADSVIAALNFTLPPAGPRSGEHVVVKDSGNNASLNNISVSPAGTDTLDGGAGPDVISTDGGFAKYISDGAGGWWKVN